MPRSRKIGRDRDAFYWNLAIPLLSGASCEVQPNVRGAKRPTAEDAMGRRPGARLVEGALTGGNRVGANGRPADRTPLGL